MGEQEAHTVCGPGKGSRQKGREKEGKRQNNVTYTDAES